MRHLLLASVLVAGAATTPVPAPPPLTISVRVLPAGRDEYELLKRANPEAYLCEVQVHDAMSNAGIGSARLQTRTGRGEKISTTHDKYTLDFSVKIDPDLSANRAETRVVVRREGAIVAEQRSSISLLPSTPRWGNGDDH